MIKDSDLKNWNKSENGLPEEGILCVVYFPLGIQHNLTENDIIGVSIGPITMAYYRKSEGWVYADMPIPLELRWNPILLKNAYWKPFIG